MCSTIQVFPSPETWHGQVDSAELRSWRALQNAYAKVSSRLNDSLVNSAGVSLSEYEILVHLSEAPDRTLRMATLADEVQQSRSRLSHTVERLEKRGLVSRFTCDLDRRGRYCALTDDGIRLLNQSTWGYSQQIEELFKNKMGEKELAELVELLQHVTDGL